MTDNEIIKALANCQYGVPCECCPYDGLEFCRGDLAEDARNLINRQKAEIEKWQGGYMTQKQEIANLEIELKAMRGAANSYKAEIERLRYNLEAVLNERADHSEAIKEFAERLEEESYFTDLYDRDGYFVRAVTKEDIDNLLLKEKVGEK